MSDRLHALALRNIRIVTTVYLLVILVATHWPKLRLNVGDSQFDKLMHFFGFGIAVGLVHASMWFRSWWALLLFGLIFTYADEITQSTLSYGRVYSFSDVVAGWLGGIVMVAAICAIRPIGGEPSRARRTAWIDASASLLARPATWIILGTSGALGIMVGAVTLLLLDSIFIRPQPARALIIGAVLGFLLLAHWTFEVGHRRERRLIARDCRCRGCGEPHPGGDTVRVKRCTTCDRPVQPEDWDPPTEIDRNRLLWALFPPALLCGLSLFLMMFGWLLVNWIRVRITGVSTINWWLGLGLETQGIIDLTIAGLLFAGVLWLARRRISRLVDASAELCLGCGQDLQGVPVVEGLGNCPECGVRFRKASSPVC